jgi:hypothetical protein
MLKNLELDPEPSTLPGDPATFCVLARMIVGPVDGPGEESFNVTFCTPEWLAKAANGGFFDARHHVVVNLDTFDKNALHAWLTNWVAAVQCQTWPEIGERLGRLGHWEFEDYRA